MQDWEQEARTLRKEWESPDLWPKIAAALEAERGGGNRRLFRWPVALAAGLVLALATSMVWVSTRSTRIQLTAPTPQLLTDQALDELRTNEAAYVESIAKLAKLAGPTIATPPDPLIVAYRERLALLDSAISELRAQAETNPLHAHLRAQLAILYREKQETLQEVLNHAQQN
jgi:hypothetical protein